MMLYKFQRECVDKLLNTKCNWLIADEMGCLDGEMEVQINRHKNTSTITIEKLYQKFHDFNSYKKYSKQERPWFIRCLHEDDNTFKLGEIVDVLYSGKKDCIKLTFDDDRILILTKDHLLKTNNGWIEAQNSLNCEIVCNGDSCCKKCGSTEDLISSKYSKFLGYCRKCMYSERKGKRWKDREIHEVIHKDGYVYLEGYPLRNYKGGCLRADGIPKHRYVMEQYLGRNLLSHEIVHHIDGNKLNNDISNLMLLNDIKAHAQFHNSYSHFKFVNPSFHKVIKIEVVGIRDTYDIKVLNHGNFLANKVVVHNCGKSVEVSSYLAESNNALPAVIICPASLKLNWKREIERWVGKKAYILSGREPQSFSDEFLEEYPVWIINYDILGVEDKIEKANEMARRKYCKDNGLFFKNKVIKVSGWCDEIVKHDFKTVICDEIQYISEPETLRSRGVKQICMKPSRKIFLSGTPYETKTSQFFTALNILNPSMFPNRWQYQMRYCNPKKTFFGWQFNGLSHGDELHKLISTFMIRRLKKDVLDQLPPKNRIVVPMEVKDSERREYNRLEKELEIAVIKHEKNALNKLVELKKATYEAKKNAVVQWIKDYLQVSDKLVVFVYHRVAFEYLTDTFKNICVGINGATSVSVRQEYIDKFQNDDSVKLFIGQIKATNAGITLTASNATCFVEFGQTCSQMIQAEDRVHRISQKADSVFAYYLVLPDSVDERIMNILNMRSKNINYVMDGTLEELFEDNINDELLKQFNE